MARQVTLFTGQWADLPLAELSEMAKGFGFDGLELACWGDHLDVDRAATDQTYCDGQRELLDRHGLGCWAISHHLAGQLVCDLNDSRSDAFVSETLHGDPEAKRQWAVETMKNMARAARNLGVTVVCGFTGSSIWHLLYSFPPVSAEMIDAGYRQFAELWNPILAVFDDCGVRFALEVHPTEVAFDIVSAHRALEAIERRETFGFNFDPSHLQWQGMQPAAFITEFHDRIYHVHMKDAAVTLDGRTGLLSSHLPFGAANRGWDFRSVGRGDVDFEAIIRALNQIGYRGPLSVEWEDSGMGRERGARESCEFVRSVDFEPSSIAFDAAFDE